MIAVLDFGGQTSLLIVKRLREEGFCAELFPYNVSLAEIKAKGTKGIILSGGPASVYEEGAPQLSQEIFECSFPILGICYGFQLLAQADSGQVIAVEGKEYGPVELTIDLSMIRWHPLFSEVGQRDEFFNFKRTVVVMSHGDAVVKIPFRWRLLAWTGKCNFAGVALKDKRWYGVQFHPEVVETKEGRKILANFAANICKEEKSWNSIKVLDELEYQIKQQVRSNEVVLLISGGVDSTTLGFFLSRIIGSKLRAFFIDTGLFRKNEVEELIGVFQTFPFHTTVANRSQDFLNLLKGVNDGEKRRNIIGKEFYYIAEALRTEDRPGPSALVAQGTLYPDTIESQSVIGPSAKIKTHHNVVPMENLRMQGYLVEPWKMFFKGDVRKIAQELGVPNSIVNKHPFPGPGLAVRLFGEITPERLNILRGADYIYREELKKSGFYDQISQEIGALTSDEAVCVQGDHRATGQIFLYRAMVTEGDDFMTGRSFPLPFEFQEQLSIRIPNDVPGISHCAFCTRPKPGATFEFM